MTDTDRQRLAAILGMLGSEHAGERAAAALQAEAFRNKHGLTWADLVAIPQPAEPPVEPAQWTPPPPPPEPAPPPPAATQARATPDPEAARFMTGYVATVLAVMMTLAYLLS